MNHVRIKNLARRVFPKEVRALRKKVNFRLSSHFPRVKRKLLENNFPRIVQIQTTSYCNASCTICPYPTVQKNLVHGLMDDATFKKIIDECASHNVHRIIPYLMNEPLADPKIIERIRYIKEKNPNAYVSISTNASLLTREKAEQLVESGIDSVGISFQGIGKEEYERIMNLDYDATLARLDYFLNLPRPKTMEVIINQVVKNAEIDTIRKFWKGRNVDTVYVGTYISRAGFMGGSRRAEKLRGCFDDDRPLKQIFFLYNGDAILCCMDWKQEIVLGNVKDQTISDIWNNRKYNKIRDIVYNNCQVLDDFICKRCEMAIEPPPLSKMINFRR